MKHKVKKAKFGLGKDANDRLFQKMVYNFFSQGTLTTTRERAKAVKSLVDTLVSKMGEKTESNKNFVLRYIQDKTLLNDLFEKAGAVAQKTRGGYVTIKRGHIRSNDGAQMATLEWAHGITLKKEAPVAEPKTKKAKVTKAPAKEEVKAEDTNK